MLFALFNKKIKESTFILPTDGSNSTLWNKLHAFIRLVNDKFNDKKSFGDLTYDE